MAGLLDRARLPRLADSLAMAVAVALPWSTSASGVLIVLWLLALLPTLNAGNFRLRRDLATAAGALPALLVLVALVGTLWADVSWLERWKGFESFPKLLAIPLLLIQFQRTDAGLRVFGGYLTSCIALLVASGIVVAVPSLSAALLRPDLVLVKNAPTQSGEFVTCIAGLLFLGTRAIEQRQWWRLVAMVAVTFAMMASMVFIATGRTALIVLLVLVALFAVRELSIRGAAMLFTGVVAVALISWWSSSYLRERISGIVSEVQFYETTAEVSSSGERIEFAKKSLRFIGEAPLIGHGTGTITHLFTESIVGKTGAAASPTTNPHNQTFVVAIQLGVLGAAVLWAMWLAHLALFRRHGFAEWVGLVVVAQNIVGSLANSHLSDFVQGWVYVFGVGVAGGMALKRRAPQAGASAIASARSDRATR